MASRHAVLPAPPGSVHPTHLLSHSQITPLRQPFFSSTYELPISQFICFDIHTKCPGVYPPPLILELVTHCKRPRSIHPLCFQTLAHSFVVFLHFAKTQLFYFQAIPHSSCKTPGVVGGGPSTVQTKSLHSGAAPSSHCSPTPLVQQWAKAREIFAFRGNNCALPGV